MEGTGGSTFEAWKIDTPLPQFCSSYGFNRWLYDDRFDESAPAPIRIRRHRYGLNIFPIRGKNKIPTLLDCTFYRGQPRDRDWPPPWIGAHGLGMSRFCIDRHNGHINGLFLDWSVKKIGIKELWTLKWNMQFNTANEWTRAGGMQPENWPEWMQGFKDY
jgi:prepilin-type processing-associated H-X9-DG protein